MANIFEKREGSYDNGGRREIDPVMQQIGIETHRIWTTRLMPVSSRWDIKNGIAYFQDPAPPTPQIIGEYNGLHEIKPLRRSIITQEDLANEPDLSPAAMRTLGRFKLVEDHLPDFMGSATDIFWNDWGVSESYMHWGKEERVHSAMAAMIHEAKGFRTAEEMEQAYYKERLNKWVAPHDTARKMLIYATLQELMTLAAYEMLAEHSKSEGAFYSARMLSQTGHDEGRHHVGYRTWTQVRAQYDLEGTKNDINEVTEAFTMPAEQFIEDKRLAIVDMKELGHDRDQVGERVLLKAVKSFGILDDDQAAAAVGRNRIYGRGVRKFYVPSNLPSETKLVAADGETSLINHKTKKVTR